MAKVDVDILGIMKTTKERVIPPWKTVTVKGLTRSCAGLKYGRMTILTGESSGQSLLGDYRFILSVINIIPQGIYRHQVFTKIMNMFSKEIRPWVMPTQTRGDSDQCH